MQALDSSQPQKVEYCIPLWLRDQQVAAAIARVPGRIASDMQKRPERVAVVCFGPSLAAEWEKIKDFDLVMTCSGAHKFLVERGITPTWHVEVDPREHKTKLIGPPCAATEYLIASTCHQAVFDHLEGFNVKLWHVFDNDQEAFRVLPHGEWAILGGCSVGLRCLTMARFLGFTDLHVFGMDGSEGATGTHAAEHPNQNKVLCSTTYNGVEYKTTPAILEASRQTWHELNQMPDVTCRFYGEGLVQAMAKDYRREPPAKGNAIIAIHKPEVISAEYRRLNTQLHNTNPAYGVGGERHAATVLKLAASLGTKNILDYGCGKGRLGRAIPFHIAEYDPAIPGKDESPKPADLVICTDVLEHIEPEKLPCVLEDLRRCVLKLGLFVIHTGPSTKTLADGRNSHLLQKGRDWWKMKLKHYFALAKDSIIEKPPLLYCVVAPRPEGNGGPKLRGAIMSVKSP